MAMLTSGMALTRRDFVSFTSEYTLTLTQLSHYLIILFNLIINKREVDSSAVRAIAFVDNKYLCFCQVALITAPV